MAGPRGAQQVSAGGRSVDFLVPISLSVGAVPSTNKERQQVAAEGADGCVPSRPPEVQSIAWALVGLADGRLRWSRSLVVGYLAESLAEVSSSGIVLATTGSVLKPRAPRTNQQLATDRAEPRPGGR